MPKKIAVLGAGSWGTSLAVLLGDKSFQVFLWARKRHSAQAIMETRENSRYLPGVKIPREIEVTDSLKEALSNAEMVILSVPSHAVREVIRMSGPFLGGKAIIVNTAKGLEMDSLYTISRVLSEELPKALKNRIAVLSGPSHAEEVSRKLPTTVVVASAERSLAEYVQDVFITPFFRVYTNPDVTGVELGGALKNVIALATGIADGLGLGDNAKAALMTRGIAEITRLGVKMGANPLTFAGLSGIGDLIVTCTSVYSRNWRAGKELGKGKCLEEVLAGMGMVVEGVRTTKAVWRLASEKGIEMPICQQVYRVLFENETPQQGVSNLMQRSRTHEVEEVVLNWENWK